MGVRGSHAAERHAQVLGLDHDARAAWAHRSLHPVVHLLRDALLQLQSVGDVLDRAGDGREADQVVARQESDVSQTAERQQVVLAQRLERDVAHQNQAPVALGRHRLDDGRARRDDQLKQGRGGAARRGQQAIGCGILTQRREQLRDRALRGRQIDRAGRSREVSHDGHVAPLVAFDTRCPLFLLSRNPVLELGSSHATPAPGRSDRRRRRPARSHSTRSLRRRRPQRHPGEHRRSGRRDGNSPVDGGRAPGSAGRARGARRRIRAAQRQVRPGSGRPAKVYLAVGTEIAASIPARDYELMGEVFAGALEAAETSVSVGDAVRDAATAQGETSSVSTATSIAPLPAVGYNR